MGAAGTEVGNGLVRVEPVTEPVTELDPMPRAHR
jgi:hypothetical protein